MRRRRPGGRVCLGTDKGVAHGLCVYFGSLSSIEEKWLKAARDGNTQLVEKLLTEQPNLITAVGGYLSQNALHLACLNGRDKLAALLLATHPALIDCKCHLDWTALHCAAFEGHGKIVARLLAMSPQSIHAVTKTNQTALHLAASEGCCKVVAQLLAASPPSIHAVTVMRQTPLHLAASGGHDDVVPLLLAANPESITQVDAHGWTALHYAAKAGRAKVFSRLLAVSLEAIGNDEGLEVLRLANGYDMTTQIINVRPEFITAVDDEGCNAVHHALKHFKSQGLVEQMLAMKPEAIYAVTKSGDTVLHQAIERYDNRPFIANLLRMNPQALRAVGDDNQTPLDRAVVRCQQSLIDLFAESVSLDELASAFAKGNPSFDYQAKYGPVVNKQCKSLWVLLTRDVAPMVFEYLGFVPTKPRPRKRTKANRNEEKPSRCCYQLRSNKKAKI